MSIQASLQSFQRVLSRRRVTARFTSASVDIGDAEAAAKKAEKRFEANHKAFDALKKPKGDRSNKDLQVILDNGNEAATAARALLRKYENGSEELKGKAKRAYESGLKWLDHCVYNWRLNSKGGGTANREDRIANTYAAAQQLEAMLRGLPAALQGKEEVLDESWRNH